jgi:hypothetical protein
MTRRHVYLFDILIPLVGILVMGWLFSEAFATKSLRLLDGLSFMEFGEWFRTSSLRRWVWQSSWPIFSLIWLVLWSCWILWNRETDRLTGSKRQVRPIFDACRSFFNWVENDSLVPQALSVSDSELEILREKLRRTERELSLFKRATHSAQIGEYPTGESSEIRLARSRVTETTSYRIAIPELPAYEPPETYSAREERLRQSATESATWLRNSFAQEGTNATPSSGRASSAIEKKMDRHSQAVRQKVMDFLANEGQQNRSSSQPSLNNSQPTTGQKGIPQGGGYASMRASIESIPPLAKPKPAPIPEWGGMLAQEWIEPEPVVEKTEKPLIDPSRFSGLSKL